MCNISYRLMNVASFSYPTYVHKSSGWSQKRHTWTASIVSQLTPKIRAHICTSICTYLHMTRISEWKMSSLQWLGCRSTQKTLKDQTAFQGSPKNARLIDCEMNELITSKRTSLGTDIWKNSTNTPIPCTVNNPCILLGTYFISSMPTIIYEKSSLALPPLKLI
jgi:hypothetical protein